MSLAKEQDTDILLPLDHVVSEAFEEGAEHRVVDGNIPAGWMGLDMGP